MRVKHNTENRSHFGVILKNQIIITLAGKYCNINSNLHNKKNWAFCQTDYSSANCTGIRHTVKCLRKFLWCYFQYLRTANIETYRIKYNIELAMANKADRILLQSWSQCHEKKILTSVLKTIIKLTDTWGVYRKLSRFLLSLIGFHCHKLDPIQKWNKNWGYQLSFWSSANNVFKQIQSIKMYIV